MTEQAKERERTQQRKQETQGNLGQKEAKQEARSDAEMARMGELTKEKNK
jgi:hypothetical protein